jgi:hypothetical protein
LAHQLARAVYDMVKRGVVFDRDTFLQSSGRGAGEPAAELGHDGRSLATVLGTDALLASTNANRPSVTGHLHHGCEGCGCGGKHDGRRQLGRSTDTAPDQQPAAPRRQQRRGQ